VFETSSPSAAPTSNTPQAPAPVAPEDRSPSLDILRGFCLLGILLTNITHFVGFEFPPPDFYPDFSGERVWAWTETFITSSFRPSLSLLFGLGFALQLRRNPNATGRFSIRLLVLLLFGLVHGYLIWNGDILTEYALVGFLLIPFARASSVTVVIWALAVFLFMPITIGIHDALRLNLDYDAIAQTFMTGSYLEFLRTNMLVYTNRLVISILYVSQTISCFLLGLWLGRVGALEQPKKHRWFLLGAFALMLLFAWWGYRNSRENFFLDVLFASPTLGFAYIAALAFLVSFLPFQKLFYFFSYTGRMPLTTYIGASVILGYLFFGYGLGWYGQFYSGEWIRVALILYGSQLIFSWLWLKFFRVGPLEWLWRSLTYGKFQPVRKTTLAYSSFGVEKSVEPSIIPEVQDRQESNNEIVGTRLDSEDIDPEKAEEVVKPPEVAWQQELRGLSENDSQTPEKHKKIINPLGEEKVKDSSN
jgi:uncharacterized protein